MLLARSRLAPGIYGYCCARGEATHRGHAGGSKTSHATGSSYVSVRKHAESCCPPTQTICQGGPDRRQRQLLTQTPLPVCCDLSGPQCASRVLQRHCAPSCRLYVDARLWLLGWLVATMLLKRRFRCLAEALHEFPHPAVARRRHPHELSVPWSICSCRTDLLRYEYGCGTAQAPLECRLCMTCPVQQVTPQSSW